MKSLILTLYAALYLFTSFKAAKDDYNMAITGEWANIKMNESIRLIKFFPNGLVNIHYGNSNQIAHYTITDSSYIQNTLHINGVITTAQKFRFTAKVLNRNTMELRFNNGKQTRILNLVKEKDIRSGNIPIK